MIYILWDFLGLDRLPFKAWTTLNSKRAKKNGSFVQVSFHYNTYKQIQGYWRHTLKDLAEYQGGP